MFSKGDRVVVIRPGAFFQKHGRVAYEFLTHVRVRLDDDGWTRPYNNDEVVHEAEWFARAADEMED
jgi:hypothetical protein